MKKFFFLFSIILIAFSSCKKNKCENVNCHNGGTCINGSCACDSVHEGANCETEKRAKYFGSYVFQASCDSVSHLDFVSFSKFLSGDSAGIIVIGNLYGLNSTNKGTILADGSIYIAPQSLAGDSVSGTVAIVNDKIVIRFVIQDSYGDSDTCTWTQKDW